MKQTGNAILTSFLSLFLVATAASRFPVSAQKENKAPQTTQPSLTRTLPRHEVRRLGFGGTLTVVGAPAGSIIIEGWERNEMDLSAEIELHAPTAEDLDRLAVVNNFAVDQDLNHIRILTTGTHDRKFMKAAVKNFPKNLFGLPWKIDYRIKVPQLIDVEINAGNGPITVSGIEGAIRINALSSNANLSLTGGLLSATIQAGSVNLSIPTRAWRGIGAEIRLASGNVNLALMPGFNADISAQVLRLGEIKNSYAELASQASSGLAQHSLQARAGNGGATISLTVGDGVIEIKQAVVK